MFFLENKIAPSCFISVVLPVRDEALYLEKSLESFSKQIDLSGKSLNTDYFEVIVLTNNCSDNSFEVALKYQTRNKSLNLHIADIKTPKTNANSGYIRRLLMQKAYERLISNSKRGGIILTTDGDTKVAEDWIAANVFEIENGADAVGGRILFSENELAKMNPAAKYFHLLDEQYRLLCTELESYLDFLPHDSFPRHHQHFNGSFAVTTETYEKAGGVPEVRCLEDVAFYQSLMRIDANFRHSPSVKVYTSARETGRTEAGLSTQIKDWINLGENGEEFLVESAETLENKFKAQGKLRFIWQNLQVGRNPEVIEMKTLADLFCVPFEYFLQEILKPQTFGLLLENVYLMQNEQRTRSNQNPLVSVEKAVVDLKNKLEELRPKEKFYMPEIKVFPKYPDDIFPHEYSQSA